MADIFLVGMKRCFFACTCILFWLDLYLGDGAFEAVNGDKSEEIGEETGDMANLSGVDLIGDKLGERHCFVFEVDLQFSLEYKVLV